MRKMFKILLSVVLTIIISISSNISVKASNSDKILVNNNIYQFATAFLNEYYYAIDQYTDYSFDKYIDSSALLAYANNKVEGKRYKSIVYGTDDMENYTISFALNGVKYIGQDVMLSVLTEVSYCYKGVDFESAYGEINHLIISEEASGYKIKDWYIPADDYDISFRGENVVLDSEYWNVSAKVFAVSSEKQEELNSDIRKYYEDLLAQTQWTESDFEYLNKAELSSSRATLYSLDRSAMVTWANNNYNLNQPQPGNSGASYYDFSEIPNNYDCTNFISHALLAGGAVMYDTGNSSTGWYYAGLNDRSYSWSGVPYLYNFLTTNTTKGPAGVHLDYTTIYAPSGVYPYSAGDILQFHDGNVWRHSTLITGYVALSASSGILDAIVTSRTDDLTFYKNRRQSEVMVGGERRVIKLSGYYR